MLIESLPQGLTFEEAARRLQQNYQAVRYHIIKFGYQAVDGRKFSQADRRQLDPTQVDWSQSNIAIAKQFTVSRERVRIIRQQLNLPPVESRGRKTATSPNERNTLARKIRRTNAARPANSAHPGNRLDTRSRAPNHKAARVSRNRTRSPHRPRVT